jgi:hypothetical protein
MPEIVSTTLYDANEDPAALRRRRGLPVQNEIIALPLPRGRGAIATGSDVNPL